MTQTRYTADDFLALETLLHDVAEGGEEPLATRARELLDRISASSKYVDERTRLIALYEVSRMLGSSLDIDEVINQVMDAVIQLTGAERGFLMLANEAAEELDIMAARNFERMKLDHEEMEVSRTVIKEVLQTGEGVVTTNAQTDERYSNKDSVTRYALRSILCQPLQARGEILGVIYVDHKIREGVFDEDDRDMLAALASQAAVAIDNARLFTQTDESLGRRVDELEMLQQIDQELNSGLDFNHVFELTLQWAIKGTNAQDGWIAILSEDGTTMTVQAGKDKDSIVDINQSHLIHVIEEGIVSIQASTVSPEQNEMTTPVRREDQTIALISVHKVEHPFDHNAELFMMRLADHAAVAIENTRLYRAAQQADRAKSQFISVASHELKIPLTSIRGYADLIRQGTVGPVTEQQVKFLGTIRDNVDRMSNLVSDLADISRIETGRLKVEITEISLPDCVMETVVGLRPQIEAKRQTLSLDLPDVMPMVLADRARLVQILANLLSNANKYTPDGGDLKVTAQVEVESVRVSVEDNGIGLSESDQSKLFLQFFRSDEPVVREETGWGLGLYVTHRLVELLGGEIGVESEIGKGSTFWFVIPTSGEYIL
jgi:signal transduction histidine kinase